MKIIKKSKKKKCKHNFVKSGTTTKFIEGYGCNVDYHYQCTKCFKGFEKRIHSYD